ncbi:hypothetical protein O9993_22355 [Vibrio lentus]|nr:hypothetical protein [Vibrio lentus]
MNSSLEVLTNMVTRLYILTDDFDINISWTRNNLNRGFFLQKVTTNVLLLK